MWTFYICIKLVSINIDSHSLNNEALWMKETSHQREFNWNFFQALKLVTLSKYVWIVLYTFPENYSTDSPLSTINCLISFFLSTTRKGDLLKATQAQGILNRTTNYNLLEISENKYPEVILNFLFVCCSIILN